ncbi:Ger(x)C family spore germination protein [Virgibacillus sp. FSP13]
MIKRKIMFLLSSSLILLLTGCWDQVDIEERGFVVGSAIDMTEEKESGGYVLSLTNQFVVPAGLGAPMQGGGGQKAFNNISASGESMFEISRAMAELTSRAPFYEHEKIIVISNKVARTPDLFGSIMDFFLRNPEMRRSIKIMISDGNAKKILDTKPENEKLPAMYLDLVMENSFKTAAEVEPVRIGRVHEYLLDETSYVIPRVTSVEKSIKYDGVAVFQGYGNRMVGILSGEETKGLNLINGEVQEGAIKIQLDEETITYEIEDLKSKMELDAKDINNVNVSVSINVEGAISETFGSENLLQRKTLAEIEKQVAKEIEKKANRTIKKTQKDLKTDVFRIDDMLKQRHYDQWLKIKEDWDRGENYFSNCTFHVSATAKARTMGSVNETKD